MNETASGLASLFEHLWSEYTHSNPRAKRVHDVILERERAHSPGTQIKQLANDHIALRTFDLPEVGLEALAKHFKNYGYREMGEYDFKEKKLYARHYEHSDRTQPKIFISELQLAEVSPFVRETATACVKALPAGRAEREDVLWSGRGWPAQYAVYQKLLAESEYAAWFYAFGFRSNHFTLSVNELKSFADLSELNRYVVSQGYQLNMSGGEIKGNPQELLEQSSTLAEKARVKFDDGVHEIPSCYYEFARRYADKDGKVYQGFIAASADKIFESTNVAR